LVTSGGRKNRITNHLFIYLISHHSKSAKAPKTALDPPIRTALRRMNPCLTPRPICPAATNLRQKRLKRKRRREQRFQLWSTMFSPSILALLRMRKVSTPICFNG